jgi:hypothetical protein
MTEAGERITAAGLAELLGSACQAFAEVLAMIRAQGDPSGDFYLPMVLAGASAANGRDYLRQAPSMLPAAGEPGPDRHQVPLTGQDAADRITGLCREITTALDRVLLAGASPDDCQACAGALNCAREISDLLNRPAT